MRGDRRRITLPDLLFDCAAPGSARPSGDVSIRAGILLERVLAGAVSFRGQGANVTVCDLLAECDSWATMVEYVGADPDHDSAGDRHGDRARALHLARPAGRRG